VDSNEDDFATEITTYRPWRITQTVRSIVMACLTTTTRKRYVGAGCGGSLLVRMVKWHLYPVCSCECCMYIVEQRCWWPSNPFGHVFGVAPELGLVMYRVTGQWRGMRRYGWLHRTFAVGVVVLLGIRSSSFLTARRMCCITGQVWRLSGRICGWSVE
jgi:hypothetical protein